MTTFIKVKIIQNNESLSMEYGKSVEVKAHTPFVLKNANNSKPAQLFVYVYKK